MTELVMDGIAYPVIDSPYPDPGYTVILYRDDDFVREALKGLVEKGFDMTKVVIHLPLTRSSPPESP